MLFFAVAKVARFYMALITLCGASLFFYGWWNPVYLVLILASIGANFGLGIQLEKSRSRLWLTLAIAINLGLIGYFKYTNFFVEVAGDAAGTGWTIEKIILPLAISFFTFQQIAYVVDCFRGQTAERDIVRYALFVVFFPQLIAGPIVHYRETVPQMTRPTMMANVMENLAVGLTYFIFGLFKKLVIADGIAQYATPAFTAVENGYAITFLEAWCAALAYTFQIYFDFSGYSDMAIGLARMFGIKLPINFNSPYKATSIVDFWRRWHMTLSAFLRHYLYFPLGGDRKGRLFQYRNILLVMLLGGLWHGAGWTFVIWGGVHGVMIVIAHLWRRLQGESAEAPRRWWARGLAVGITFIAVVFTWVLFRAESIDGALTVMGGMLGLNGIVLPPTYQAAVQPVLSLLPDLEFRTLAYFWGREQIMWFALLLALVWFVPNTHQIMHRFDPALNPPPVDERSIWRRLDWRPSLPAAVVVSLLGLAVGFMLLIGRQDEFLYFQF